MPGLNPFAATWAPPSASDQPTRPIAIQGRSASRPEMLSIASVESVPDTRAEETEEHGDNELLHAEEHDDHHELFHEHDEDFLVEATEDASSLGGDSDSPTTTLAASEPCEPVHRLSNAAYDEVVAKKNEEALCKLKLEVEQDHPVQIAGMAKVGLEDFEMLQMVGQGAFGKVFQVRYKKTNQLYAMKVMRKEKILQKDHSEYVKSERDLLTAVTHPYIVALRFSFQTPSKLYLILDFLNGGHLFFNLYREGVFGEDVARLYTAEIVSAISYLHANNIMHRDLKPENVLLDTQGHVRLTDFGLAKGNMDGSERSNSFIGTMEYMAPEIIDGKGHTKSVDWWSTGILLYEMLCGVPPFRAKSRKALQEMITTAKPKFPKFLSTDAQNLLKGLLAREPSKRLGSGPTGSEEIRKHPFFKTIDWAKLERREIESKFKPTVRCSQSVENFDKIWTGQPAIDSPCGTPPTHACQQLFQGFTYVEPNFLLNMLKELQPPNTA